MSNRDELIEEVRGDWRKKHPMEPCFAPYLVEFIADFALAHCKEVVAERDRLRNLLDHVKQALEMYAGNLVDGPKYGYEVAQQILDDIVNASKEELHVIDYATGNCNLGCCQGEL